MFQPRIAELEATVQEGCALIYRGKGERNALAAQLTEAQGKVSRLENAIYSTRNLLLSVLADIPVVPCPPTPPSATEPREVECPHCKGDKGFEVDTGGQYPNGGWITEWDECEVCDGTGKVTPASPSEPVKERRSFRVDHP